MWPVGLAGGVMASDEEGPVFRLPHKSSVAWRRSSRQLEDEDGWDVAGTSWSDLLTPAGDIYDVYKSGAWSVDTWVVDGLVRSGSNLLLVGESNVGKTYLALSLAVSVLTGERFLSHFDTDIGPVLYIAGEGDKEMLVRRINNLVIGLGIDPHEFFLKNRKRFILSMPTDTSARYPNPLANREYQAALTDRILRAERKYRPRLFIWDPLTALYPDVDRDPSGAQSTINWLKSLNKECDAASVILHHPKKVQAGAPTDHRSRIRGDTSWVNFSDDVIFVDGDTEDANVLLFWSNKARDMPSPGDTEALFTVRRTFNSLSPEVAERHFSGSTPGALQAISFMYGMIPPRSKAKGKGKGKGKGEEDEVPEAVRETMQAIRQALLARDRGPLSRSLLADACQTGDPKTFALAISHLVNGGELTSRVDGTTAWYWLLPEVNPASPTT